MKCPNCGFEFQDDFKFCTNCGTEVKAAESQWVNPLVNKVLSAVKDNMFLAICILMTVSSALSVIGGGLPVINILITIFIWLTYTQALKGIADQNHLRSLSGSVYASYVVGNVTTIIFIVCGVVIAFLLGLLANGTELFNALESELGSIYPDNLDPAGILLEIGGWIIGFVFVLIGASGLVINVLGMKKIHGFVKSIYQGLSLPYGEASNPHGAKNWLIFFGVCSALSALSSLLTNPLAAIASGCTAAAIILAVVLINKYFLSNVEK